jgi:hypothetical protein
MDRTSQSLDWLTLQLAWRFIDTCDKEHDCGKLFRRPIDQSQSDQLEESRQEDPEAEMKLMKPPFLNDLPARLIYLNQFGEGCLDACLVEVPAQCKQFGTHIDYAALSYCWGSNPDTMYITTKETLGSRMNRIAWSELPKTVQDAISIVRGLAIPCLWVDAICIIQNSKPDWEQESAKMGAIYASAIVTIAADASDSINGGILDIADAETVTYNGHVQIPAILEDGSTSKLMFYNHQSNIFGVESTLKAILDSPLSSRAWCLQERMLSSRILHFTKQGLVLECREEYKCVHMVWPMDRASRLYTVPGMLHIFDRGLPQSIWGMKVGAIVSSLTEDQLKIVDMVMKSDTSVFVSYQGEIANPEIKNGDQEEIVRLWNKHIVTEYSKRRLTFESDKLVAVSSIAHVFGLHIDSQYIAGLWLVGIEEGLEWRRSGIPYGTKKLIYPSFSWLSHPGSVSWPYVSRMRPHGPAFSVVEAHTQLAGPNLYGSLISASLILYGRLRNVLLRPEVQEHATSYHIKRCIANDLGEIVGEGELDFDETVDELQCFYLYRNSHGFLRLLLLQKTESEGQNQYKRAGIGFVYPRHGSWLEQAENQTIHLI